MQLSQRPLKKETLEKVEEKMRLAMTGYFETFPDERRNVLTRTRIPIAARPVVQESGGRQIWMTPFPISH